MTNLRIICTFERQNAFSKPLDTLSDLVLCSCTPLHGAVLPTPGAHESVLFYDERCAYRSQPRRTASLYSALNSDEVR